MAKQRRLVLAVFVFVVEISLALLVGVDFGGEHVVKDDLDEEREIENESHDNGNDHDPIVDFLERGEHASTSTRNLHEYGNKVESATAFVLKIEPNLGNSTGHEEGDGESLKELEDSKRNQSKDKCRKSNEPEQDTTKEHRIELVVVMEKEHENDASLDDHEDVFSVGAECVSIDNVVRQRDRKAKQFE